MFVAAGKLAVLARALGEVVLPVQVRDVVVWGPLEGAASAAAAEVSRGKLLAVYPSGFAANRAATAAVCSACSPVWVDPPPAR